MRLKRIFKIFALGRSNGIHLLQELLNKLIPGTQQLRQELIQNIIFKIEGYTPEPIAFRLFESTKERYNCDITHSNGIKFENTTWDVDAFINNISHLQVEGRRIAAKFTQIKNRHIEYYGLRCKNEGFCSNVYLVIDGIERPFGFKHIIYEDRFLFIKNPL